MENIDKIQGEKPLCQKCGTRHWTSMSCNDAIGATPGTAAPVTQAVKTAPVTQQVPEEYVGEPQTAYAVKPLSVAVGEIDAELAGLKARSEQLALQRRYIMKDSNLFHTKDLAATERLQREFNIAPFAVKGNSLDGEPKVYTFDITPEKAKKLLGIT